MGVYLTHWNDQTFGSSSTSGPWSGGGSISFPQSGFKDRTRSVLTTTSDHKSPTTYFHGEMSINWSGGYQKTYNSTYVLGIKKTQLVLSQYGPFPPAFYSTLGSISMAQDFSFPGKDKTNLGVYFDMSNVLNGALAGLRNNRAEIGNTVGELRQSLGWLASRATSLLYALKEIKKGRVLDGLDSLFDNYTEDPRAALNFKRKKKRGVNRAANAWLESRFAIRPLVGEVYDLYNIVDEGLEFFEIVSSKASKRFKHHKVDDRSSGILTEKWVHNDDCQLICKLLGKVNSTKWTAAKALGLDNPLAVAWELVPFSFVLDWVLPVGDFLEAFTGPVGLDFYGGYYSYYTKSKGTYTYHYDSTDISGGGLRYINHKRAKATGKAYTRLALNAFPMPQLPSFENALKLPHLLDITALFTALVVNKTPKGFNRY